MITEGAERTGMMIPNIFHQIKTVEVIVTMRVRLVYQTGSQIRMGYGKWMEDK